MLTKFGPVLTFILTVALVALLAVTVCFQHERTGTEDFRTILPDNDGNMPNRLNDPSNHYYELSDHSRKAQHQQNAINSERNYELAVIPFAEPVLIEPRDNPKIGREKLDVHPALTNGVDFDMWTGDAVIGGHKFRLLFDTTSFGLWIPSMDSTVQGKVKFNFDEAHYSVKEMPFKTGIPRHRLLIPAPDEKVHPYRGQVIIGGKSGFNTLFWTVKNFKPGFEWLPFDGVLGLGFPSLGNDHPGYSFLGLICARNVDCIFSFYLANTNPQLHLLKTDPKCFKEDTVEYHRALPYLETHYHLSHWVIGGGMIKINGVPTVADMKKTILDTTTGFIYGPSERVQAFYEGLRELHVEPGRRGGRNLYFFHCGPRAKDFKISFSWGGRDWEWTVDQLVLFKREDGKCAGAIQARPQSLSSANLPDAWVVGTSFLRMVYATFHRNVPGSESWVRFAEFK